MNKEIELLAPAGSWEAFVAAIENGADAVYLGGKLFNARQFAGNFDAEQLKKALDYAHVRGAKVYLTMNILLSDREIKEAIDFVEEAYCMGIDGIIVQDIGLAGVLRRLFPDLELHASTQMTVYNLEGVRVLEQLGFKRVVLARELSLQEIDHITRNAGIEIEIFIHGALCVCYSGQCLMSSIIGGRSGNRGKCAQPCRLPYELLGMEKGTNPSKKGYLLSPKDLCSIDLLQGIIGSGVKSLKIEGRMKSPEYVATVVGIYRKYLNKTLGIKENEEKINAEGINNQKANIEDLDLKKLMQAFNRGGFSKGYFQGKTGSGMMCYEKPKNWGIYLGEVVDYNKAAGVLKVKLEDGLSIGDGIEIWNGEEDSPGTLVSEIKLDGKGVQHADKGEYVSIGTLKGRVFKGHKVYKTSDKLLNAAARETFAGNSNKRISLECEIKIIKGAPVTLIVKDESGNKVEIEGTTVPETAINRPLTKERIIEQLNKTGQTPFEFKKIDAYVGDDLSVPISEINNIRRTALEEMEEKRAGLNEREMSNEVAKKKEELLHFPGNSRNKSDNIGVSLFFYNSNPNIHYASLGADRLYLPFRLFLNEKIDQLISSCKVQGTEVFACLPSITKGNYDTLIKNHMDKIVSMGIDGFLVGNIGSIKQVREITDINLVGDYTLNVFNSFSCEEFSKLNIDSVTLSPELTFGQISHLRNFPNLGKEVLVYGRIPVMTSEYCPVGSIVGKCNAKTKCNEACTKDAYKLRDRKGMEFPVLCDNIDCRSTILNSNVLLIPDSLDKLVDLGVNMARINITDEKPDGIREIVNMHRETISNGIVAIEKYEMLIQRIKAKGFTKGHYFRGV